MKSEKKLRRTAQVRGWNAVALGLGAGVLATAASAQPQEPTQFSTLTFGSDSTYLTGIRGSSIVGFNVNPVTGYNGGLLYDMDSETWTALPVATPDGVNFPGAISSSPYGPSFGTQNGILRTVGSYETADSAPFTLSYLYDAAAAPGQEITYLDFPDGEEPTLFTIAHSTFGNQVVGNYDVQLISGNAFIYNVDTGAYTTNNVPGAFSSTNYGIYGNRIAGGFAALTDHPLALPLGPYKGLAHGFIYNQTTDEFDVYDHPGAIITHFEGITGAGRANTYNLVTDWVDENGPHPAVMHIEADGTYTWYEINIPGDIVSANSAYGDKVIGVYAMGGMTYGYVATIPGLYNPIINDLPLAVSADGATGIATDPGGDDVFNLSTILVSGAGSVGIGGETYGVINNEGSIAVTGAGSAGVRMNGLYGTLLNTGEITALPGSSAITSGETASGTVIVNTGLIDGRVVVAAGQDARFDNSGWLGVTAPGSTTAHQISGTFAQTSGGTLGLWIGATASDTVQTDIARLDGTLIAGFEGETFLRSYQILTATGGLTGTFASFDTVGLPGFMTGTLSYGPQTVTLNIAADFAPLPGLTPNETAVGAALAGFIDNPDNPFLAALPEALSPLYALDAAQLPQALDALSGESYASEQSVLLGDSLYSRLAVLGRLRQGAYAGQTDALALLTTGGPTVSPSTKGMGQPFAFSDGATTWAEIFGSRTDLDGDGDTFDVTSNFGGVITGADTQVEDWRVGAAVGYSQSSTTVDGLSSSADVDSLLAALYAGTSMGAWNIRLGASYASNETTSSRTIAYPGYAEQASADYNSGTTQLFAEVAYGLTAGTAAVEPFAGLAWVNVDTDGFSETGASAGLSVSSSSSSVTYGTLGIRAATSVVLSDGMVLKPRGSIALQNASGDLSPAAQVAFLSAPGAGFSVGGAPLAETSALIEIGADLLINPQATLGVSYVGQYADDGSNYGVQANVTWRF